MLSIIEQLKLGKLWDFPGGIHPPEQKTLSNQQPIAQALLPDELIIPLKQHLGAVGSLCVNVGDKVLKGQVLTRTDVALSVPVHAPTSGVISAIESRTIAHPSGLSDRCIVLKPDGDDRWGEKRPVSDYPLTEPADLIEHIRSCGISGMGGAGFPTARKLQSALGKTDLLIINAAECEPYITADDRLMQDHADEIVEGIRIISHILKPKMTVIGIEDNKPEAVQALTQAVTEEDGILIRVIPTKYPSGGEKQLIKILTGREVPTQGIPADIGIMMQNIGTAHAIKRAVINGEPLIQRVVTVTGQTIKEPCNTWTLLGTPVQFLLNRFGYKLDKKLPRVIMGGPMMGFTLPHTGVPITKTANCILAPSRKELSAASDEMSCIRCTACAEACPVSLLPQQLQWYAKDGDYDKCEEYNLFDCIECGACAYVCPSEIPLVHYYRQAKAEIRHRKQDELSAERAKQRFEAKKERLEREKEEREQRFKKAANQRRKDMAAKGGDDAVAAAIARVKAKKETDTAGSEVKPAVAAAIAKAKAKQAEALAKAQSAAPGDAVLPDNSDMAKLREQRKQEARERKAARTATEAKTTEATSAPEDKKAAVAAAIARAKARKAAQQADQQPESSDTASPDAETVKATASDAPADDPKKAAVAAAIARAKARKAAQQAAQQPESSDTAAPETEAVKTTASDAPADDPKKAAVAAAIARAKARKAAQQADQQPESSDTAAPETEAVKTTASDAPADDPKKAAVAAAIARAKARKAAQQAAQQPESSDTAAPETEAVKTTASDAPAEDPKKAAVAAAIARAKARKAAQQAAQQPESSDTASPDAETVKTTASDTPAEDPKKAAVAAAIARAKARKAAQEAAKKQTENNHESNEDN
ncbi:electron transport complex subunit RsxC [Photobacterium galatheae]|uniref:electron transport complex subunit RsxC n=1 Tax=Photobacterium galatheae TaxID=1654360 RepID=UPI00202CF62D|nr:electron transport complex subunit RsxC [Photobacterium galatheae]MCM0147470.1 electron transport complex subunit RsxC [Photobacterium galatheae]